jgi:hypothetical protein
MAASTFLFTSFALAGPLLSFFSFFFLLNLSGHLEAEEGAASTTQLHYCTVNINTLHAKTKRNTLLRHPQQ